MVAIDQAGNLGAPVAVGATPSRLAVGEGALWVGSAPTGTVRRIDPGKGVVVQTIALPGGVDGLAVTHLDVPERCPGLCLCDSYVIDGAPWRRSVPGAPRDLDHQSALTERLRRARPGEMRRPGDWSEAIGRAVRPPPGSLS